MRTKPRNKSVCLLITSTLIVGLAGCPAGPATKKAETLPKVSIRLLKPVENIEGMSLSADLYRQRVSSSTFTKPNRLSVYLPGREKPISLVARSTSFIAYRGVVEGIYARRPVETVTFQQAVADAVEVFRDAGLEPTKEMNQMKTWGDIPGAERGGVAPYSHYAGYVSLSNDINIGIDIEPDPNRGWYDLITIGAKLEASRAAESSATRATTRSSAIE